jgi:hypothetical protein
MASVNTPAVVEIGVAELRYNEQGSPISAVFTPAVFTSQVAVVKERLMQAAGKNPEDAKQRAQTVLAEWFEHLDSIEMTDREKGYLDSQIVECEKWPDERPKLCKIRFFFVYREDHPEAVAS